MKRVMAKPDASSSRNRMGHESLWSEVVLIALCRLFRAKMPAESLGRHYRPLCPKVCIYGSRHHGT